VSTQQTVTLYALVDNTLIYSTTNSAAENTVYSTGDISSGCNWVDGPFFDDWVCGATAIRFDTSTLAGKTIISAYLRLWPYILAADFNTTYGINAFVSAWNTNSITFANAPNYYLANQVNVSVPLSTAQTNWNVTGIVSNWASGAWVNNGMIIQDNNYIFPNYTAYRATSFDSLNTATGIYRPSLVVTYQ
jgi:hypothetical protein